jgi:hypothetical protein
MNAQTLILAERLRQTTIEGWTSKHDDEHREGELAIAAFIYMHHGTSHETALRSDGAPMGWPWEPDFWKPKDRQRNLERAGGLLMAEIERRQRAKLPTHSTEHALQIVIAKLDELLTSGV